MVMIEMMVMTILFLASPLLPVLFFFFQDVLLPISCCNAIAPLFFLELIGLDKGRPQDSRATWHLCTTGRKKPTWALRIETPAMPTLLQEQKCSWKLDEDMDPAAVRGISNQSVTADLLWPQTSGFVAARASYFHFIDQLITRASYQTI